ncbi:MAG: dihydrolipoyl dehydrogenase [Deltaproteobacteria bacterium]|nr:dihydrolipoyl dehydrogenase [Deltaproteobacteria bacterium]
MSGAVYDLIVIGAGPGGYTAAIRASQLGLKTVVVERDRPGGICLNWGCIPSKAILHCAELVESIRNAGRYGIECPNLSLNYSKVIDYSRKVADQLAQGVQYLLKKNRVELIAGTASFLKPNEVLVQGGDEKVLSAAKILIATGSKEKRLPGLEIDGKTIISSSEALILKELPESVVIIGGGAIGVEFGYAYGSFGSNTTIVEMMDHLLPEMDEELGRELERSFKKRKIQVLTQTRYKMIERAADGGLVLTVEGKEGREKSLSASLALVAVGREALTETLGLERLKIETEKGFIKVDDQYRTSSPGVYAIGDVIGPPLLAHAASAEGIAAVEMMAGQPRKKIERQEIPACVYCQPEVASVGLNESEARAAGHEIRVGKFPFRASGKAMAVGEADGWVKVVSGRIGEILGVQIIGKGATDLIAEAGLAQKLEATVRDLGRTVHAHPTLSEALMEASLAACGESINF